MRKPIVGLYSNYNYSYTFGSSVAKDVPGICYAISTTTQQRSHPTEAIPQGAMLAMDTTHPDGNEHLCDN